jgi:outer membrane protein TolC
MRIGSVADVDTASVRRAIEAAKGGEPAPVPAGPGTFHLTLEEALELALQHNLPLQIATFDRDAAELLVTAAEAKFDPVPGFEVLASDGRFVDAPEDPVDATPGEDIEEGTQRTDEESGLLFVRQELRTAGTLTLSGGLDRDAERLPGEAGEDDYDGGATLLLRQPLLRGGGFTVGNREITEAGYSRDIFEAQLQAAVLAVSAQAQEAYWNALLAQRLIEVSDQAIARDHELIEASHALFRAGRASQRDVVSAQIRLADDESLLALRRGEAERRQLVLLDVLGAPIGSRIELAEQTVPFEPVEIRLGEWIGRALENRPELMLLAARLGQSALAVRLAGNGVMPALDFLGAYSRLDFDESSRTAWSFDSQVWTAGLHFEIPFGNVAARDKLRAAKLVHERVERELRNQQRQIEIEVRTETIGLAQTLENLSAQIAKLEDSRAKLEIANTRYQLGLANNFDVTDAQNDLVDAESALLQGIVDYANGLVRLEARIAGPL